MKHPSHVTPHPHREFKVSSKLLLLALGFCLISLAADIAKSDFPESNEIDTMLDLTLPDETIAAMNLSDHKKLESRGINELPEYLLQAIQKAVVNDFSVLKSSLVVDISRDQLSLVRTLYLPKLHFTASYGIGTKYRYSDLQTDFQSASTYLTLSYVIYDFGYRSAQSEFAGLGIVEKEFAFLENINNVAYNILAIYLDLTKFKDQLQLIEESIAWTSSIVNECTSRHAAASNHNEECSDQTATTELARFNSQLVADQAALRTRQRLAETQFRELSFLQPPNIPLAIENPPYDVTMADVTVEKPGASWDAAKHQNSYLLQLTNTIYQTRIKGIQAAGRKGLGSIRASYQAGASFLDSQIGANNPVGRRKQGFDNLLGVSASINFDIDGFRSTGVKIAQKQAKIASYSIAETLRKVQHNAVDLHFAIISKDLKTKENEVIRSRAAYENSYKTLEAGEGEVINMNELIEFYEEMLIAKQELIEIKLSHKISKFQSLTLRGKILGYMGFEDFTILELRQTNHSDY